MADDSWDIDEILDYHPCDTPRGTKYYNFDDITDEQQILLNEFKINLVRDDEMYLAKHPEIRAIVIYILKKVLRHRPIRKVPEFIAKLFLVDREHIQKEIDKYIASREPHKYEGDSAVFKPPKKPSEEIVRKEEPALSPALSIEGVCTCARPCLRHPKPAPPPVLEPPIPIILGMAKVKKKMIPILGGYYQPPPPVIEPPEKPPPLRLRCRNCGKHFKKDASRRAVRVFGGIKITDSGHAIPIVDGVRKPFYDQLFQPMEEKGIPIISGVVVARDGKRVKLIDGIKMIPDEELLIYCKKCGGKRPVQEPRRVPVISGIKITDSGQVISVIEGVKILHYEDKMVQVEPHIIQPPVMPVVSGITVLESEEVIRVVESMKTLHFDQMLVGDYEAPTMKDTLIPIIYGVRITESEHVIPIVEGVKKIDPRDFQGFCPTCGGRIWVPGKMVPVISGVHVTESGEIQPTVEGLVDTGPQPRPPCICGQKKHPPDYEKLVKIVAGIKQTSTGTVVPIMEGVTKYIHCEKCGKLRIPEGEMGDLEGTRMKLAVIVEGIKETASGKTYPIIGGVKQVEPRPCAEMTRVCSVCSKVVCECVASAPSVCSSECECMSCECDPVPSECTCWECKSCQCPDITVFMGPCECPSSVVDVCNLYCQGQEMLLEEQSTEIDVKLL